MPPNETQHQKNIRKMEYFSSFVDFSAMEMQILTKQRENYEDFFYFLAKVLSKFGGKLKKNENSEQIEIGIDGANKMLESLKNYAEKMLIKKAREWHPYYECQAKKTLEQQNLKMAAAEIMCPNFVDSAEIFEILNGQNELFKSVPKGEGNDEKVDPKLVNNSQVFNLLYSFATRIEAIIYGKNADGTIIGEEKAVKKEKKMEAKKDGETPVKRIHAFIAATKCFDLPYQQKYKKLRDNANGQMLRESKSELDKLLVISQLIEKTKKDLMKAKKAMFKKQNEIAKLKNEGQKQAENAKQSIAKLGPILEKVKKHYY
ncbi:hypothetical protein niasHT_031583 [Heterodera trifolii]|uniref:Uncharacterized protein n=1 Tax=Heterodera trifolii TaxID=157864 RepID=A0ABD2J5P0_9BILA